MRLFLALVLLAVPSLSVADTYVRARRVTIVSAQEEADALAAVGGPLRHCGRAGGLREGLGFSTAGPDAALRSCCFFGRFRILEKAVAWSPIRRGWYAVIRYAD